MVGKRNGGQIFPLQFYHLQNQAQNQIFHLAILFYYPYTRKQEFNLVQIEGICRQQFT